MSEPNAEEGRQDVERGAAEETAETPITPTEEDVSHRPPGETPAAGEEDRPGGGTARPEDLSPDDFE